MQAGSRSLPSASASASASAGGCGWLLATPAAAAGWRELLPGVEYDAIAHPSLRGPDPRLHLVRIDPDLVTAEGVELFLAGRRGGRFGWWLSYALSSIEEEIDGDERLRGLLVSALLLGSTVMVPEGEDVGGDFANVPLCRDESQTGCVITYRSFRDTAPPSADSGPGETAEGMAACTNPASLGGGWARSGRTSRPREGEAY